MSGKSDVVAFDFAGNQLWQRNLYQDYGHWGFKWSYASSPILHNGTLYIQALQRKQRINDLPGGPSYLLAIDPTTGKDKWQHQRPTRAVDEAMEAYSTPIPVTHNGRSEILVLGGDCITGHDPGSGKELWRWGTWNRDRQSDWRMVSSPIYGNGVIAFSAPKGGPVYTLSAGANRTLNIGETLWIGESQTLSTDVTSPLFLNQLFFFLNGRKKTLTCLDPYTGDIKWSRRIPARSKIEASPSGTKDKLYIISHTGEVFIFRATQTYELIHSTILGRDIEAKNRSTIVPSKGMLLIRVGTQLWCMK